VGLFDLLLDERIGLVVHLGPYFGADLFELVQPHDLILILAVHDVECILQPIFLGVLLGDAILRQLELLLNLLRLRQRVEFERSSSTLRLKMQGNMAEHRVIKLLFYNLTEFLRWQIVWMEDFVFTLGEGSHRQHQPVFVGEVGFGYFDSTGQVFGGEVLLELLYHDQFGRRFHALSEDDIRLPKTEDLRSVHLGEGDLVHELAVEVRHEETISGHEFMEGCEVSKAGVALLLGGGCLRQLR
jgi:hypothetical protein